MTGHLSQNKLKLTVTETAARRKKTKSSNKLRNVFLEIFRTNGIIRKLNELSGHYIDKIYKQINGWQSFSQPAFLWPQI